jgi:hypothetical protein
MRDAVRDRRDRQEPRGEKGRSMARSETQNRRRPVSPNWSVQGHVAHRETAEHHRLGVAVSATTGLLQFLGLPSVDPAPCRDWRTDRRGRPRVRGPGDRSHGDPAVPNRWAGLLRLLTLTFYWSRIHYTSNVY